MYGLPRRKRNKWPLWINIRRIRRWSCPDLCKISHSALPNLVLYGPHSEWDLTLKRCLFNWIELFWCCSISVQKPWNSWVKTLRKTHQAIGNYTRNDVKSGRRHKKLISWNLVGSSSLLRRLTFRSGPLQLRLIPRSSVISVISDRSSSSNSSRLMSWVNLVTGRD